MTSNSVAQKRSSFTKGEQIAIANLPEDVQNHMKRFDFDGDGCVDSNDLAFAATLMENAEKENSRLKKFTWIFLSSIVLLLAAIAGLTYGIVVANQEVALDGLALTSKRTHEAVAVNTNELELPIATLGFLPADVVAKVKMISFQSEDESTLYFRSVVSIDVKPNESFVLKTEAGDSIMWGGKHGVRDVVIELADAEASSNKTVWVQNAMCAHCTATSVVMTAEVEKGIVAFQESWCSAKKGDQQAGGNSGRLRALKNAKWDDECPLCERRRLLKSSATNDEESFPMTRMLKNAKCDAC